ncbi:uncharacterized protein BDZ83DRAFT_620768 [Colletotrichum acutatum]|uniref:Uncharacterized protein n=1 Tax=Glomerella acutata TaxID=27357 RepID=A0AAD8UP79_GLOAC|nr:uncharacterized protein BDZ83DRAFT_620768 [Colletotrichum acutatum]KAK1725213.1 hypothetical protein BDZ83DRAFT_620768 [Colletotrichum acutatum]
MLSLRQQLNMLFPSSLIGSSRAYPAGDPSRANKHTYGASHSSLSFLARTAFLDCMLQVVTVRNAGPGWAEKATALPLTSILIVPPQQKE